MCCQGGAKFDIRDITTICFDRHSFEFAGKQVRPPLAPLPNPCRNDSAGGANDNKDALGDEGGHNPMGSVWVNLQPPAELPHRRKRLAGL